MTIEQRKISIINWITNLQDESVLNKIEDFRKSSLNDLSKEIVQLLNISDSESMEDSMQHTNSKDILNRT